MTTTITFPDAKHVKASVGAGETSSPIYVSPQCVVVAKPGSGGTMLVEATWSSTADVDGGTANWFAWDAGAVSAIANQLLLNARAVRFTATTQIGTAEVAL